MLREAGHGLAQRIACHAQRRRVRFAARLLKLDTRRHHPRGPDHLRPTLDVMSQFAKPRAILLLLQQIQTLQIEVQAVEHLLA